MPSYAYKAIDSDGKLTRGTVTAEDRQAVQRQLQARGWYFLDARRESELVAKARAIRSGRSIKRRDAIEFATNLSVMLRAGVPIVTALGEITKLVKNRHLQNVIEDIRHQTEMGRRFSDTFLPHRFPEVFVKIVQVGEETGQLEQSLTHIAEHLQKMEDLAASIKRALIYPAFAIVATLGALTFWMVFVLPNVMATMKDLGAELPFTTRMLARMSDLLRAYWYMVPIGIAAAFTIIRLVGKNPKGRYFLDGLKLKLPILKLVMYNKLLAVFSEQLRILITAGLTIDKSLTIIADVMNNAVFHRAITLAKDRIAHGSTISGALKEHEVFPPMLVRMVDIGEKSGTLDDQFAFLSDFYIKKLDDISQKMGKIIEPLVIGVLGIFFAIIISGLLLPIYDLVGKVGKG